MGIARVPDARVEALARMYSPKKKTPATVEYVDVPGVAKGEGAALVDLPALRGVDALVHVVRAFETDAGARIPRAAWTPCATRGCWSWS